MSVDFVAFPGTNITLVYNALSLPQINRDAIRRVLDDKDLVVVDTPELLIFISPRHNILIQLGDRRLRVIAQNQLPPPDLDIVSYSAKIHKQVRTASLLAYGFNYDVIVKVDTDDSSGLLKKLFIPNEEHLASLIGGNIEVTIPRFVFSRDQVRYDLAIEPIQDAPQLKAHLNAHFPATKLPVMAELKSTFNREFEDFQTVILRLLEGQNVSE